MIEKTCSKCGQAKPLDQFYKDSTRSDGHRSNCKACHAPSVQSYRDRNTAAVRQHHKASRDRRMADPQSRAKMLKPIYEWQQRNPWSREKQRRKWDREHPLEVAVRKARCRAARTHAGVAWADQQAIDAIYREAAQLRAAGCDVHVDHFYPVQGKTVCGLHVHQNLRIVDRTANLRKSARMPVGEETSWPDHVNLLTLAD